MQLTPIHFTQNCDNASCPTIYKNEKGNFVIQGFKLKSTDKDSLNLPEEEDLVEVPADFLQAFIDKNK